MLPPQNPPRRTARSRDPIIEINAATGPHTPVPPPFDKRETLPPLEPDHEIPRARPAPRVPTQRGMPAPPSDPPPKDPMRDSGEISQDTLLDEYRNEAQARRAETEARKAAEARARDAELKLAAAESGVHAQGPSLSLGSARWWVLVLGALAIGGPLSATQIREWFRPSVTPAQVQALREDLQASRDSIADLKKTLATSAQNDAKRWTLLLAFACSQGFRARGLDCDAVQKYADFEQQPLTGPNKVRGAPQWKAGTNWPPVPVPTD